MPTLEDLERQISDLRADIARLSGPHVEVIAAAYEPNGEQIAGPQVAFIEAEGPTHGMDLGSWLGTIIDQPGIVLDPTVAHGQPCIRVEIGDGRSPLVYQKGIIGSLDADQQALYCGAGYTDKPLSDDERVNMVRIQNASQSCSAQARSSEADDVIQQFFSCIASELSSN